MNFGFFPQLEASFEGTYNSQEVSGYASQMGNFSLNLSDGIKLNAFIDDNANGTQDFGEANFPLGHFNYEINGDGIQHSLYSTPYYLYESNPTTTYHLSYTTDSEFSAYNVCTADYPNVTVAPGSGITTYNFPVTVTPYQDVAVNVIGFNPPPRPGFTYYNYISYTNNSTQPIASGTVTFVKDPTVTIVDSYGTITPTGVTYNFTNLPPYQTEYIWVRLQTPTIPTINLGDLVTATATVTIPGTDVNLANNTSSLTQTIVGSYDPNDKSESHGSEILHFGFTANDYLTYTIRFENTGTANAVNINVTDTLDPKLDETTVKMVDASATYSLERTGSNLIWHFYAIDLPPSGEDDPTVGHGYVTFKVKPKAGYVIGDVIENTADIYFDFNPAIVTNTVSTAFVAVLSADQFNDDTFKFYPNPVKDVLHISLKRKHQFAFCNRCHRKNCRFKRRCCCTNTN
ncbi:DUF7619 domain-containing protein [Flavobacterium sp. 3HN19-14]|uniref:DUF7619 domain-containing protein n=1 Tax=Flavobacterium sp. 3HN19-14 TaxID=3448133 RepID=UPI003EDF4D5C